MAVRRSLVPVVVAAAVLLVNCDTEPPEYGVHPPVLRLITDQSTVPAEGGYVFVVIELSREDGGLEPRTVFLRAEGATSTALPGPSFCLPDAGEPSPVIPEADGGLDGGLLRAPDGGSLRIGPTDLVFPYVAFRHNEGRNTDETGVLISIPKGSTEAVVMATAYRSESAVACSVPNAQLEAIAFLRITRASPGTPDGSTDGGSTDGGSTDGGSTDGGSTDGGSTEDGGVTDGGPTDAGTSDAGGIDGGMDAGVTASDAGSSDGGNADGGDAG